MDYYRPQPQTSALGTRIDLRAVMKEVYLWMALGLVVSTVVALLLAITGITTSLGAALFIAPIGQIAMVWYLSARIFKMEPAQATRLFLIYAALMGVTLSFVFYWASMADIYVALFATGAMFAAMSIVGYTTEIDLTRMGSLLFMALIGLIVASVINLFIASAALYWLVSVAGVLIFTALVAFDTQWIKNSALTLEVQGQSNGAAIVRQLAIMGALKLYLDFINLFLFILRLLSGRD